MHRHKLLLHLRGVSFFPEWEARLSSKQMIDAHFIGVLALQLVVVWNLPHSNSEVCLSAPHGCTGAGADSRPGWDGGRARGFITLLRMARNLKLMNSVFLEFST